MATGRCLLAACLITLAASQSLYYADMDYECPRHWKRHEESCYRFVKSPLKRRDEARTTCQAYQSDLLSINTPEEHLFLIEELLRIDPQHRTWYTGVRQSGGYWSNEPDGSQWTMDNTLLPLVNDGDMMSRDFLAYSFSNSLKRWGLERVTGHDPLLFICEAPISILHNLIEDDRTYTYGVEIDNPLRIPRGPYFITQPKNKVFDVSKRLQLNQVTLSCYAGGYPTPTYEWYKEYHQNARLVETPIDPLSNRRYTLSGGSLIINNPTQNEDRGSYHCKASNRYGVIISESVELSFGYILEFNLKRSQESGTQNWGKTVYCDPPQHYPGVKYYWARDYFPNFVEEDKRVFSSNDGALYFSALEPIDKGNYSCNVQSIASDTGRNGPFFPLSVQPHGTFQDVKFANNFPKVFPEAPVVGEEVRLECVAFGYPVPAYNWTRRGSFLPRGAYLTSYNRVLTIPRVRIEDQGEYVCRAHNERLAIQNSVWLTIQATPNFTIPLEDKHMDNRGELTWMCEAFGVPDVTYNWFKNGKLLDNTTVQPEDIDRYVIQDNVLRINRLDPERDSGMYQCRARNQLKTTYSSAQLRVLSLKPSFKKHPMESETYAAERRNVTIVCNPEAAPRPKFVWKKDGNVIGAGGRRRILDNGNLIISPVSRDDEGTYVCIASNTYGSDETRGRLIVLRGPNFVDTLPQRIHTAVMYNQTLRCLAETEAILDIAYTWTHNGIRIRDKDLRNNRRIKIDEGVMDITNITLSDAGEYECIVESAVGRIITRTLMIVDGPPGPPGGVTVANVVKTSATLEWTDGALNGRPILYYTIGARTRWVNEWFNITENVTAMEFDRLKEGRKQVFLEKMLNPYTTYQFRVYAANELGYGPPSMPSPKYSTTPDKPFKAPSNVGGGGGKIGDLSITWDPLKPEDQNAPGIYYNVSWRRTKEETEFQSIELKQYGNVGSCVVRVQMEYYYTEYDVMVQAINDIGSGPHSPIVVIRSAEDRPRAAPEKNFAIGYNSTSLNVTWKPLEERREIVRGKLIGYRIKYWLEGTDENAATYYLSRTTRPWALIVGLQPDKIYVVTSMAYNSAGAGPESQRWIERTYRKPPQMPPSSVDISVVNPSTVYLTWRYTQPGSDEEPIDGFKVRVWELDQDMSTANDTIIAGGKLEAYVYNLVPGKMYNLRVLAFSRGGDGRMSSPITQFQMGDEREFRNGTSNKIVDSWLAILLVIVALRQCFF